MAKLTKRQRLFAEKIEPEKAYAIDEAVSLLNELSKTKFGYQRWDISQSISSPF